MDARPAAAYLQFEKHGDAWVEPPDMPRFPVTAAQLADADAYTAVEAHMRSLYQQHLQQLLAEGRIERFLVSNILQVAQQRDGGNTPEQITICCISKYWGI